MWRDVRGGLRWLRKNPLFTAVVTATLALGIAAVTAVFSMVDAVLLRPLPYAAPATLVQIEESASKDALPYVRAADYLRWRERSDLFAGVGGYRADTITFTGIDTPDQVLSMRVSGDMFAMLGVRARLGRTLAEADDAAGAPLAAVLSDKLWRRLFHADRNVIGRSFRTSDELLTVVGVMAPEFEFPAPDKEMWLPLRLGANDPQAVSVIARLRPGVSLDQANGALAIVARQIAQEDAKREGLKITASRWRETAGPKAEATLLFVLSAVGLLLLIACANVASLMLSRAVERRREIAIRACLGAGVWRVVRQLLVESALLAAAGSAAGVGLAVYLLQILSKRIAVLPVIMPRMQQVTITGRVLLFNVAVCVAVSVLFGLVPVLVARRLDLQAGLRGGRGSTSGSARWFSMLIAVETALSFLLLAGAGLMIRSLIRLQDADHGFRPDHVLTLRVPIGTRLQQRPRGLDNKKAQMAYLRRLVERLESVPGVRAAAIVNNLPLSGFNTTLSEGYRTDAGEVRGGVRARTISSQYFAAMGIPIVEGRAFTEEEREGAPPAVIFNEYLAHRLFPSGGAAGRKVQSAGGMVTVVGVVRDSAQMSYEQPPEAEVYLPYQQFLFGAFLATAVVRTEGDPRALASTLQKEVWMVNRDQPIVKVETMEQVVASSIWRPRFSTWVLSVVGGLALLLMSAGVYGVIAYTAGLRAKEVGIRVALGARPQQVAAVIIRGALVPVAAGLTVSFVAALALQRLLASVLYEVRGTDPLTYAAAGGVLLVIGVLASASPAWKAATADPVKALRSE